GRAAAAPVSARARPKRAMLSKFCQISSDRYPMYEKLALYIDGEFLEGEGRKTQDIINPSTLEVLGKLPLASTADLDRALAAAQRAFESWRHSSPMKRSEILRRVGQLSREQAQEIGRNMTLDQGKPLAESVG